MIINPARQNLWIPVPTSSKIKESIPLSIHFVQPCFSGRLEFHNRRIFYQVFMKYSYVDNLKGNVLVESEFQSHMITEARNIYKDNKNRFCKGDILK